REVWRHRRNRGCSYRMEYAREEQPPVSARPLPRLRQAEFLAERPPGGRRKPASSWYQSPARKEMFIRSRAYRARFTFSTRHHREFELRKVSPASSLRLYCFLWRGRSKERSRGLSDIPHMNSSF